ncbi:MAG: tandem-95 repeat protein [Candidatus Glassbacteria bacterium]|nr:tandem-95 repeat protein [Candidatus Glassbacteria bacterium]
MSFSRLISSAALIFAAAASTLLAQETDHTWSLSGALYADRDTSVIYIGVANNVDEEAFTIELHYDTSLVERLSEKQIGRAADMSVTTNTSTTAPFRRFAIFDLSEPSNVIEAGSDSIIQVGFRVKDGVALGTPVAMYLTTSTNRVAVWDTLVVPTNFEVTGAPNSAPVFVDPGALSGKQGSRFSLQLEAADEEGDALVYRLITSPGEGAVLDSLTGLFTWTPQESGTFTATFEVSDGTGSDTLTVNIQVELGNVTPSWPSLAQDTLYLTEGSVFTHTFDRPTDVNLVDVLTVTTGTLPGTAAFDRLSLTLSWTPGYDNAGTYEIILTAADDGGLKAYQTVYLLVADVNREPVLNLAVSEIEVGEGQPVSFSITASDPDRDALTVSWNISPAVAGARLANRVFSWPEAQVGTYTVEITVTDPSGLEATGSVSIVVSAVNEAPVFGRLSDFSVDAGELVQVNLAATDPDGDELSYSIVLASETENILTRGATFSGNTFSWTPASTDAGPNLVTFRVEDPEGLSDEASFAITVLSENVDVPVSFGEFAIQTVEEGSELVFELNLADAEAFVRDSLEFWAEGLPEGALWDAESGTITWTPNLLQSGTYTVTCGVSDGSFEDIQSLTIEVVEKDVPPVILPIQSLSVNEGELLSVTFTAVDSSSADPVLFTATGLPDGAEMFDGGLLYYQPGYDAFGSYGITVTATDGTDNTDSVTVTLTVNDVNRSPEIEADNREVAEGQLLVLTVTASDPDGDDLTLAALELPTGASFDPAGGNFSWTPTQEQSGNWTVVFTADDGNGGVDSAEVIVTVGDVNRPPVLDPLSAVAVREGEQVTISITASDPDAEDKVTVSATNLPQGASLTQSGDNPVTATIAYTPGYQRQGVFSIKITATDDDAAEPLAVSRNFKLRVDDVDVAPEFTGGLAGSAELEFEVDEGDTLNLPLTVTDAGGDDVDVRVLNAPRGARIEPGSPDRLIYLPGYDVVVRGSSSRRISIEITARDGSQVVSRSVTIVVNDVNRPPRIPSIDDQVVDEGKIITFLVNTTDPDGDGVQVSTAGRVPYLTAGNPPPAQVRDGNVFIFDTGLLPQDSIIRSAVFQFWGVDDRGLASDTVQVEIAVRRDSTTTTSAQGMLAAVSLDFTFPGMGTWITFDSELPIAPDSFLTTSVSGNILSLLNRPGSQLAGFAGEEKAKGVYAYTFLAGELESQFYGIRRGWQLDLTAYSAAEGADSLVPGMNISVTLSYNDEDLPSEIPNFSEDRIKVFGYDGTLGKWVLADSQSVDTTLNVATFKLTNPQLIDYTIGAVLDVVAPVITDLRVSAGGWTIDVEDVDTLYSLDGTYQFRVNVTDDEVVSSTGVTLFYAVGEEDYRSLIMERSGVNLFLATVEEGVLADGTVISYYIEARDEMNVVLSPQGAPGEVYELVVAEYTGTPGDLDGNISINIFDVLELLKVLGGKEQPSIISDVDQNGTTDIFDLLALLKLLGG